MGNLDYKPLETKLNRELKKEKITKEELAQMDFEQEFDQKKFNSNQRKEFKRMLKIRVPLAKELVRIRSLVKYKKEKDILKMLDKYNATAKEVNDSAIYLGVLDDFKVDIVEYSDIAEEVIDFDDAESTPNLELEANMSYDDIDEEITGSGDTFNDEMAFNNDDISLDNLDSAKLSQTQGPDYDFTQSDFSHTISQDTEDFTVDKSYLKENKKLDKKALKKQRKAEKEALKNQKKQNIKGDFKDEFSSSEEKKHSSLSDLLANDSNDFTSETSNFSSTNDFTSETSSFASTNTSDQVFTSTPSNINIDSAVIDEQNITSENIKSINSTTSESDISSIRDEVNNKKETRILQADPEEEYSGLDATYDIEVEHLPDSDSEEIKNSGLNNIKKTSMSDIDSMIDSTQQIIKKMKTEPSNYNDTPSADPSLSSKEAELERKVLLLQREIDILKQKTADNSDYYDSDTRQVTPVDVSRLKQEYSVINDKLKELALYISDYELTSKRVNNSLGEYPSSFDDNDVYESLINKYLYNDN